MLRPALPHCDYVKRCAVLLAVVGCGIVDKIGGDDCGASLKAVVKCSEADGGDEMDVIVASIQPTGSLLLVGIEVRGNGGWKLSLWGARKVLRQRLQTPRVSLISSASHKKY